MSSCSKPQREIMLHREAQRCWTGPWLSPLSLSTLGWTLFVSSHLHPDSHTSVLPTNKVSVATQKGRIWRAFPDCWAWAAVAVVMVGGFWRETFQRGQGTSMHFPVLHPCPLQCVLTVNMSISLSPKLHYQVKWDLGKVLTLERTDQKHQWNNCGLWLASEEAGGLEDRACNSASGAVLATEPCGVKGHSAGVCLRTACELVLLEKSLYLLNWWWDKRRRKMDFLLCFVTMGKWHKASGPQFLILWKSCGYSNHRLIMILNYIRSVCENVLLALNCDRHSCCQFWCGRCRLNEKLKWFFFFARQKMRTMRGVTAKNWCTGAF